MGTSLRSDFLQAVHGARGGLDEGSIDVADVLDLEETALGVGALQAVLLVRHHTNTKRVGSAYVFGETTIKTQNTVCLEVLAEKLLAFSAVEASYKARVSHDIHRILAAGLAMTYQWPQSSELSAVTRSPISKPLTSSAKPRRQC